MKKMMQVWVQMRKVKKINQRSEILTLNIMVVVTEYCLNEIVINGYKS